MKKIISDNTKALAITDYLEGMSYREVGKKYSVYHKTVRRWVLNSGNKSRSRQEANLLAGKRLKGARRSPNSEFKKGCLSWNTGTKGVMKANSGSFKPGRRYSPATEFKRGKLHPCYVDGKGREPYPYEFDARLKRYIRERDRFICQNCGINESAHKLQYNRKLHIHHINYNKKDCNEFNLITLCLKCNLQANYNRSSWEIYYKSKIEEIKNA